LFAAVVTGSALMGQLLMTAALPDSAQFFTDLIRGSIGTAEALPFYLFNTPMEWLIVPAALLLNWNLPARRNLLLVLFGSGTSTGCGPTPTSCHRSSTGATARCRSQPTS
jgi:hypothetical protein